ncbi:MAG: hypothetical protein CL808_02065 [Citromicrobium sp.]|nr:hypothetical protein [Citromicrobium sp.]
MMNSRAAFVAVGLGVSVLTLLRGVVLMTVLAYDDLGLVALVQSVILFSGLMHFGLLNGGYRLLCHAGPGYKQRIIDLAYTGFGTIGAVMALAAVILSFWLDTDLYRVIAGLAAIAGFCTLVRSWMTNEMVAAGRLGAVNMINASSMLASLAVLVLLYSGVSSIDPALVAVMAMAVQPVLFVTLSWATGAALKPRRFKMSRRLAGIIFSAGFTLFLTGIAIQLMNLMERSYVLSELGLEPLGRLYLAFLFVTLFQLAPNLIQQVFLPNIVKHRKARDAAGVSRELRHLLAITVGYSLAAIIALWLLAEPLLGLVLPQYVADLHWVYLIMPGLIAFTLSSPFALTFNVVIDYTWYVVAYGAGVLLTIGAFGVALLADTPFSLDGVMILRSAIYTAMAVLLVIGWWRLSRRYPEFRLRGR